MNDVLFFAGGKTSTNSQPTCSVETLNTNTGARTLMNLFSPASWLFNAGQSVVAKDNKLLFLRNDGKADANKFDIYDTAINTWSVGVLPVKIEGASFISVNNTIYLAGGKVNGVLSDKVYKLEF
jgi:hypothetical protein